MSPAVIARPLLVMVALGLAACEAPIDPLVSSDLHFSLSGYLDASADTQWVRVEALGPVTDRTEAPLAAGVTLVGPRGVVPMAQEVRVFETGPAHLFWTAAVIEAGETYTVVAQAPDGAEARTDVRIPDTEAVAVALIDGLENCPTGVVVDGAARVVDVQARYEVFESGRLGERYRMSKLPSLRRGTDNALRASIYYGDDALLMNVSGLPWEASVRTEVMVAVGTDDWPDFEGLTLEGALAAADLGHVDGGVGFVGGVVTRTLTFEPGLGRIPPFAGSGVEPLPCEAEGPRG